jgi:hypothetical protein
MQPQLGGQIMSQQTFDSTEIGTDIAAAQIRASLIRDKRVIMPNPVIIGLAMLSGAAFLYLIMLFEIVPVKAVDGHVVTMFLAALGIGCAVYGWARIFAGEKT